MTDITSETPVAATPPTPENVASMLTSGDNDYHDGNEWHPSISALGNVVRIAIEPYGESEDPLPKVHFRAVVVEGETAPVVVAPELLAAARALYRVHVIGPALASEEFARLVYGLGEALEALTPEQVAVLAGDDEQDAGAETGGAQ